MSSSQKAPQCTLCRHGLCLQVQLWLGNLAYLRHFPSSSACLSYHYIAKGPRYIQTINFTFLYDYAQQSCSIMENPLLRLLIPMTTLQQLLRKSSTNSEMIRLSPTSSSCVMTTLAALYLYQVRRVLCSGLMPIPMERPRLHSKETTAPWKNCYIITY